MLNKKNIFLVILFCIMFQLTISAETLSVQNSKINTNNSVQKITQDSKNQSSSDVNANSDNTPAHAAVTGSITPDEINKINKENKIKAEIIDDSDDIKIIPKQEPSKRHLPSVLLKFLLALIWVCISSIIIFLSLVSYKKFALNGKRIKPSYESKAKSLDVPTNFKEAIKLFLDKTKWD
ncbi:hypothetical protein IJG72_02935 [bacterium]|nr:hypothetical protein [bacterium]